MSVVLMSFLYGTFIFLILSANECNVKQRLMLIYLCSTDLQHAGLPITRALMSHMKKLDFPRALPSRRYVSVTPEWLFNGSVSGKCRVFLYQYLTVVRGFRCAALLAGSSKSSIATAQLANLVSGEEAASKPSVRL